MEGDKLSLFIKAEVWLIELRVAGTSMLLP